MLLRKSEGCRGAIEPGKACGRARRLNYALLLQSPLQNGIIMARDVEVRLVSNIDMRVDEFINDEEKGPINAPRLLNVGRYDSPRFFPLVNWRYRIRSFVGIESI